MHDSFTDLSTELIIGILCYLSCMQLVRCRGVRTLVCQRFRTIVDGTPSLQYIIELEAAGYEICVPSTISIAGTMELFRKTQRSYRDPNPRTVRISLEEPVLRTLLPPVDDWSQCWRPFGDIAVQLDTSHCMLRILSLRDNLTPEDRVRTLRLPFAPQYWEIDRSQDLILAISDDRACFLSLKDGSPHSRTIRSMDGALPFPDGFLWGSRAFPSIDGDLILLYLSRFSGGYTAFLYHWPSGKEIKRWHLLKMIDGTHLFYGCLTRGHVFFPTKHTNISSPWWIDMYRLPDDPVVEQQIVHVASFGLFEALNKIGNTLTAASTPVFNPTCRPIPSLLQFNVGATTPFFISLSSLFAAAYSRSRHSSTPAPRIPWSAWGPRSTRLVGNARNKFVVGRRVFCDDAIIDFNLYDVAHNIYVPVAPLGQNLGSGGVNDPGSVFLQVVSTTLPGQEYINRLTGETQMPYRRTHLPRMTINDGHTVSVVEEDGEVKASKYIIHRGANLTVV
ncbi:hypothetical protein NM688_g4022 [Phlebia brevispora]|uniref:Uncharacterized protein n=1 Tax=Phlebia brevispora TaxID=194682 RepID=A0ACC1T4H5_9APHY|nr:hypothetical protein NM688_g4022 [Phlebia brevispora]